MYLFILARTRTSFSFEMDKSLWLLKLRSLCLGVLKYIQQCHDINNVLLFCLAMSFIVLHDNCHKWGHWNLRTPGCMLHGILWWINDTYREWVDTYKYRWYVTYFHLLVWCASLCGWEREHLMQRIGVHGIFSLQWLRTLGRLFHSSFNYFCQQWSTRRWVSAKPSQF